MSQPRKALSNKNSPRRLHLSFYAVVWLLMDRLQPDAWVWWVVGVLCAALFYAHLYDFFTAEEIEL